MDYAIELEEAVSALTRRVDKLEAKLRRLLQRAEDEGVDLTEDSDFEMSDVDE